MSKVSINESTLTAIGNAIRAKTGKSDLIAPGAMPTEIEGIETGGGSIEVEPIVLTGNCDYACAGLLGGKYIDLHGNSITTDNITSAKFMFLNTSDINIPFEINMSTSSTATISYMFQNTLLTTLPKINNAYPKTLERMFDKCSNLTAIPDGFGSNWNWSYMQTNANASYAYMLYECPKLRYISKDFLKNVCSGIQTSASYSPYQNLASSCYLLDELNDIEVLKSTLTSNHMYNLVYYCSRLKNFTFAVNDDGTPKTANWKNQNIALTSYVGYARLYASITDNGIGTDKQVTDDATYQALKDDPDWWTGNIAYSRYNHDSAVATINSLPDTSAYGTNTIKFKGESGSATDGGAINTLTEEEIAVATAKGWTVSFV